MARKNEIPEFFRRYLKITFKRSTPPEPFPLNRRGDDGLALFLRINEIEKAREAVTELYDLVSNENKQNAIKSILHLRQAILQREQ